MAKIRTRFVCQSCGLVSAGWLGRCPSCDSWDSFVEEVVGGAAGGGGKKRRGASAALVQPIGAVEEGDLARFGSGIDLFDRVLGGGVVAGSAVLLAGDPGIGKSTLLLAAAEAMARAGRRVLYVSAEESPRQLRLRAERLGCAHPDLLVAGETGLEPVLEAAASVAPRVLMIDSIQALKSADLSSLPGSIGQVRACAEALVEQAKGADRALFLVGHVTKQGSIAGPKSLEHLVDTVLAFEGDGAGEHRLLRASKNRFGPTGEVALFEMHDDGLTPVTDPSRVLLARRRPDSPGSAVAASLQGSRPLLVEVQALVHDSALPTPRRMAIGLDGNRVALLVAVLERFAGLSLAGRDLYLNVVGGIAVKEPAVDLAVVAAIASALGGRPIPEGVAFFGEVGLLGELRPVGHADARLREVSTLGFDTAVTPPLERVARPAGLRVREIEHLSELAARLAGDG